MFFYVSAVPYVQTVSWNENAAEMKRQNSKLQIIMLQENQLMRSLTNTQNAVKSSTKKHMKTHEEVRTITHKQNSHFKNNVVMHRQAVLTENILSLKEISGKQLHQNQPYTTGNNQLKRCETVTV